MRWRWVYLLVLTCLSLSGHAQKPPGPAAPPPGASTPAQWPAFPSVISRPASAEHVRAVTEAQQSAYALRSAANHCPVLGADLLGWPGGLIRRCDYVQLGLEGVIYLLDIQADATARWIESGCDQEMPGQKSCFATVLECGRRISAMMFPVSGNMLEQQGTRPFQNFFYRNGMLVEMTGQPNGTQAQIPTDRQDKLAQAPDKAIAAIPTGMTRFWRTTPAEYAKRFPTMDVQPSLKTPAGRQKWLDTVKLEMTIALSAQNNRLLDAWIAAHRAVLARGVCP